MLIDEFQAELDKTDSYITCISLLDDLLNHCDGLIKSNDNHEEWSESFLSGVYAVRGKISYLKSKLDKKQNYVTNFN